MFIVTTDYGKRGIAVRETDPAMTLGQLVDEVAAGQFWPIHTILRLDPDGRWQHVEREVADLVWIKTDTDRSRDCRDFIERWCGTILRPSSAAA